MIYFDITQKDLESLSKLMPKNMSKFHELKKQSRLLMNPSMSFNKGKAPEIANLSAVLTNKQDLLTNRSRDNSYAIERNLSRNLSWGSSCKFIALFLNWLMNTDFYEAQSQKDEEANVEMSLHVNLAGFQGEFLVSKQSDQFSWEISLPSNFRSTT